MCTGTIALTLASLSLPLSCKLPYLFFSLCRVLLSSCTTLFSTDFYNRHFIFTTYVSLLQQTFHTFSYTPQFSLSSTLLSDNGLFVVSPQRCSRRETINGEEHAVVSGMCRVVKENMRSVSARVSSLSTWACTYVYMSNNHLSRHQMHREVGRRTVSSRRYQESKVLHINTQRGADQEAG